MSKYINADEFTATIRKSTSPSGAEWIVAKVNEMPSADVVEVVRCKDCVYFNDETSDINDVSKWHKCDFLNYVMDSNGMDYCSYGERKETDD